MTGGCLSNRDGGSSVALPVLVALTIANDTDQEREYQVRVQFAADAETTPGTVSESGGTIGARDQRTLDSDWPKEPGRYSVEVSVDGGRWHVQDITDRLKQEEQVCYHQELTIKGRDVAFPINPSAPCPD